MKFLTMTAKEYRNMIEPKKNKYNAVKTEFDGIEFDSKKEERRYIELKYMERAGKVSNLQRQVRFILQEGFVNNEGKNIRPISYIADYVYEKKGKKYVEDVKSPATRTQVYLLKKKMFMYKYPEYVFVEY